MSKIITTTAPQDDALMGAQLTEQYQRATGAMGEILKFGAMLMVLRDTLSAREHSGHGIKGDGVKGWLEQHAPEVNRTTAYRFLHVTEAVAKDFQLPAKVSFVEIATKPTADLSAPLQKKQAELWDFVNGTSQRSWLDRFNPAAGNRGGSRDKGPAQAPPAPEEIHKKLRADCAEIFDRLMFVNKDERWHAMSDEELRLAIDVAGEFVAAAKKHLATPKSERLAAAWQKAA